MEIHLRWQVLRGFVPEVIWPGEPGFFYALTINYIPVYKRKGGEYTSREDLCKHFYFCRKIVIILFANSRNIVIFVLLILRCKKSTFKLKKGGTRGNESEGSDFLT